jgi:DNA-binding transcriptional ArsR family regulator
MQAKPEYRDRGETEVAVLDALVDRPSEGMTVFELRSHVDADIDTLEDALGALKADGLIDAEEHDGRTVFTADERVLPDGNEQEHEESWLDAIRRKIGF